jgi:hypothetical protein
MKEMKKLLMSLIFLVQAYGSMNNSGENSTSSSSSQAMSSKKEITKEFLRHHVNELNGIINSDPKLRKSHGLWVFESQKALNEVTEKIREKILIDLSSGRSYEEIILSLGTSCLQKKEKVSVGYSFLLIFLHNEIGLLNK